MCAERDELTLGDRVVVLPTAPAELRPGETADVIGYCDAPEGQMVIVEFANGSSIEIDTRFLRKEGTTG